jgi:hypothetical protein
MILAHYYALLAIAVLLTGAWLFRPENRTAVTTAGAFFSWGLLALLGGSTEVYRRAGERVVVNASTSTALSVERPAELVASPVPDSLRFFFLLWSILSALALVLFVLGVYPPDDESPVDEQLANQQQQ